jgi:LPS-assembly lipoprotein
MQKLTSKIYLTKIGGSTLLTFFLLFLLMGCGFHLRGTFSIPPSLQILRVCPNIPIDPLQRPLRQILKGNGVQIIDEHHPDYASVPTLTILSQALTERAVAYGTDGQVNRSAIQLAISYQITDAKGKVILPCNGVRVERMLTVNPNAVLGTDNERTRVNSELYQDGAMQLVRQLSMKLNR